MNENVVVDFRPHEKNTLKGFLTLTYAGLVLREVCLHAKGRKRWIAMPARPYKRDDGASGWVPMVEFADAAARSQFQALALAAIDQYFGKDGNQKCS
jgi:hypothetical protein